MRLVRLLMGMLVASACVQFAADSAVAPRSLHARRLTALPNDELEPRWSPDGTQIAFIGHQAGNPDIYMADAASGEVRPLTDALSDDFDPRWSPDGRYLTFVRRSGGQFGQWGWSQLFVVEVATGRETALTWRPVPHVETPVWTPDGRAVIFLVFDPYASEARVWLYEPATGEQRAVFEGEYYLSYALLADGALAVRESYPAEERQWRVELSTGRRTALPALPNPSQQGIPSPDGRVWALASSSYPNPQSVTLLDTATGDRRVAFLTPQDHVWLTVIGWSPQGQLALMVIRPTEFPIVNSSITMPGNATDFYLLDAGRARLVGTIDHPVLWAELSPDGRFIGFNTYAGVYVLDPQTGVLHNLIYGRGYVNFFAWSPDGAALMALIVNSAEYVLELDIAELRTGQVSVFRQADWWSRAQWSPDGRRIVVPSNRYPDRDLWLLTLAR